MNTWHWYVACSDELLLDLDSEYRLASALNKLQRADKEGSLNIRSVYATRSYSEGKFHAAVRLNFYNKPLSQRERIIWAWWAGSDPIRAMYNLMRVERLVGSPDLLISPAEWTGFWRRPDYLCHCETKHRGLEACQQCAVFQHIHGLHAGKAYFPLAPKFKFTEGAQEWPPRLNAETKT